MYGLDAVILVLLVLGAVRGWQKGLVVSLFTLCGCLVGLVLAYMLNARLGVYLAPHIGAGVGIARALSFFLIWVAVPIGMGLVGRMFVGILNILCLGLIDKLGGAVLGVLKYSVGVACVVVFCSFVGIAKESLSRSVVCTFMEEFAKSFISSVPEEYSNGRKE